MGLVDDGAASSLQKAESNKVDTISIISSGRSGTQSALNSASFECCPPWEKNNNHQTWREDNTSHTPQFPDHAEKYGAPSPINLWSKSVISRAIATSHYNVAKFHANHFGYRTHLSWEDDSGDRSKIVPLQFCICYLSFFSPPTSCHPNRKKTTTREKARSTWSNTIITNTEHTRHTTVRTTEQ